MSVFKKTKQFTLRVRKSSRHVYAELINNTSSTIEYSVSTLSLKLNVNNVEASFKVGEKIGNEIINRKLNSLNFDRNGYLYHGKIKAIADGARKVGVNF